MLSSDQFRRLLAEIPIVKNNISRTPGYNVTRRMSDLSYLSTIENKLNEIANRHPGN